VATSSATTALFLSLVGLGMGPGDEVIVPSFSFIATANVVVQVGAKPVFADIDLRTYNIDPDDIEKKITARTKAIIAVDQFGLACDLDKIKRIAKKHNLEVVEDAACATGGQYKGKMIGSMNKLCCFSFHPRKLITAGEGGMITTNSKRMAEKFRLLRHHGMSVSDVVRHKSKSVVNETYSVIGYNFRMTSIQGAIMIEQLKKMPRILARRRKLAEKYSKVFERSKYIIPPWVPEECEPNWQSYVVRVDDRSPVGRDELMQRLLERGIATRRGNMAAHLEPVYKKKSVRLPQTEIAVKKTMTLPLYVQMTDKEQKYVIENVLSCVNG
jgi:perosamine synthetase